MSRVESYPLYQTLSGKLSKKEPTVAQKKELSDSIDKLYENQKEVFVRLILEHARINNNLEKGSVPYGGVDDEDGTIVFDINNPMFPVELKWILIKFFKICSGEQS